MNAAEQGHARGVAMRAARIKLARRHAGRPRVTSAGGSPTDLVAAYTALMAQPAPASELTPEPTSAIASETTAATESAA